MIYVDKLPQSHIIFRSSENEDLNWICWMEERWERSKRDLMQYGKFIISTSTDDMQQIKFFFSIGHFMPLIEIAVITQLNEFDFHTALLN